MCLAPPKAARGGTSRCWPEGYCRLALRCWCWGQRRRFRCSARSGQVRRGPGARRGRGRGPGARRGGGGGGRGSGGRWGRGGGRGPGGGWRSGGGRGGGLSFAPVAI